jgi:large subunit ribosomal protein L21
MYAIVTIAGKQYRVAEGDRVKVATLPAEVGAEVRFDHVLLTDDGTTVKVGTPAIAQAAVAAEVLEHGRERKILVYKKKRRKGYQRKKGHRQDYTLVKITKIELAAPQKKKGTKAKPKAAAKTSKEEA